MKRVLDTTESIENALLGNQTWGPIVPSPPALGGSHGDHKNDHHKGGADLLNGIPLVKGQALLLNYGARRWARKRCHVDIQEGVAHRAMTDREDLEEFEPPLRDMTYLTARRLSAGQDFMLTCKEAHVVCQGQVDQMRKRLGDMTSMERTRRNLLEHAQGDLEKEIEEEEALGALGAPQEAPALGAPGAPSVEMSTK